jgi:hypothetical protein
MVPPELAYTAWLILALVAAAVPTIRWIRHNWR